MEQRVARSPHSLSVVPYAGCLPSLIEMVLFNQYTLISLSAVPYVAAPWKTAPCSKNTNNNQLIEIEKLKKFEIEKVLFSTNKLSTSRTNCFKFCSSFFKKILFKGFSNTYLIYFLR